MGPLSGKRILITRTAGQATSLATPLADLGAEPVLCPTIAIIPPEDYAALDTALDALETFHFLILTSPNAVHAFFARLRARGLAPGLLQALKVVAVGPKTAQALASEGITTDLVPTEYRAEGVVALLKEQVVGKRVLYPKAARARELIPAELADAGAEVVAPVAYASAAPADASARLKKALDEGIDLLTFTASSTVENFVELLSTEDLARAKKTAVASIGPLTTATAKKLGFNVVVEPDNSTLDDMVEAISRYFEQF